MRYDRVESFEVLIFIVDPETCESMSQRRRRTVKHFLSVLRSMTVYRVRSRLGGARVIVVMFGPGGSKFGLVQIRAKLGTIEIFSPS